jgi:hypothetical protein
MRNAWISHASSPFLFSFVLPPLLSTSHLKKYSSLDLHHSILSITPPEERKSQLHFCQITVNAIRRDATFSATLCFVVACFAKMAMRITKVSSQHAAPAASCLE